MALPAEMDGRGVSSASLLALPGFLTSAFGVSGFSLAILQDTMNFREKCINVHRLCAPVDYLKKMLTTFSSVVPCMTTTDLLACKLLTL